jgi:Protein of unknown function (DUF3489)
MRTQNPQATATDKPVALARHGSPASPDSASSKQDAGHENRGTTTTTFAIDTDNNITAFPDAEEAPDAFERFTSKEDFAKLSSGWPIVRFTEVWNAFAGVVPFEVLKPVKRFTDRKAAVNRIWKAIQALTPRPPPKTVHVVQKKNKATKDNTSTAQAPTAPPKTATGTEGVKAKDATPTAREGSKKAIIINMLNRTHGATLQDLMDAIDWQACCEPFHSQLSSLDDANELPNSVCARAPSFSSVSRRRSYDAPRRGTTTIMNVPDSNGRQIDFVSCRVRSQMAQGHTLACCAITVTEIYSGVRPHEAVSTEEFYFGVSVVRHSVHARKESRTASQRLGAQGRD